MTNCNFIKTNDAKIAEQMIQAGFELISRSHNEWFFANVQDKFKKDWIKTFAKNKVVTTNILSI